MKSQLDETRVGTVTRGSSNGGEDSGAVERRENTVDNEHSLTNQSNLAIIEEGSVGMEDETSPTMEDSESCEDSETTYTVEEGETVATKNTPVPIDDVTSAVYNIYAVAGEITAPSEDHDVQVR